ncbi:MAG TPA: DUF3592 domain-containing protein [Acidobacteriota bacterium]|nr:DUF3592 domain-containing protein [Acidobacteriota bacterium]HNT18773.1 DUF3592 domain-containing protein [Acidobacteriota bacterium]
MAEEITSISQKILGDAVRMLESGAPFKELHDQLWFGFCFHTNYPVNHEGLLEFAFRVYDNFRDDPAPDREADCALIIARVFTARKEHLPACRFYLAARKAYKGMGGITAMEFFREEVRRPEAQKQICLSKEQFEERFSGDAPESLAREYRPASAAGSDRQTAGAVDPQAKPTARKRQGASSRQLLHSRTYELTGSLLFIMVGLIFLTIGMRHVVYQHLLSGKAEKAVGVVTESGSVRRDSGGYVNYIKYSFTDKDGIRRGGTSTGYSGNKGEEILIEYSPAFPFIHRVSGEGKKAAYRWKWPIAAIGLLFFAAGIHWLLRTLIPGKTEKNREGEA